MTTQAALDGISANGLRWRGRIRLGQHPAMLGKLNDAANDGGDVNDAEVEKHALAIVNSVRASVTRERHFADTDLASRADDLELMADCGLDEVNEAMGELYDSFDFHRILVKGVRL